VMWTCGTQAGSRWLNITLCDCLLRVHSILCAVSAAAGILAEGTPDDTLNFTHTTGATHTCRGTGEDAVLLGRSAAGSPHLLCSPQPRINVSLGGSRMRGA
jgi:hypothetical protein